MSDKPKLQIETIYYFKNGYYRRLLRIDDETLHFETPAFHEGQVLWVGRGSLPRKTADREFHNAKIVTEDQVQK